jgi:hypothetical protein
MVAETCWAVVLREKNKEKRIKRNMLFGNIRDLIFVNSGFGPSASSG